MRVENLLVSTIEQNTGISRNDIRNTSEVNQNLALDAATADITKSTENSLIIESGKDLIRGKNFEAYL
ncbi:MAG TPA: hypothetical protein PLD27_05245 [bacterium]|nr:hypothetical protein [bacterium]HOL47678.1 hypothetical protein [bacterium]HPQ18702.1 hypothetical protein [bacterium]